MQRIVLVLAGLMGAAGIVLAAGATHVASGEGLKSASTMLLFHACAAIAVVLTLRNGLVWPPLGIAAACGFVLGAALFSGDLSLRAFAGQRLFPMAAPIGGTVLIASWVAFAAAALLRRP